MHPLRQSFLWASERCKPSLAVVSQLSSDPACAGPYACGGGASLKEAESSLMALVADSLKAYCCQDAPAHVCCGVCGGYEPLRAPQFYWQ